MATLIVLNSAQHDIEEIAKIHMNLAGINSSKAITNKIWDALTQLEIFPLSGVPAKNKMLHMAGYRYIIAGKYLCIYRVNDDVVFVYRVVHGARNYPTLFKTLKRNDE